MAARPAISIVIPVFNEEESVERLVETIRAALQPMEMTYELLLVDDGSTDGTRSILRRLSRETPELRTILFRRNYGQTAAMAAGFRESKGDVIITMDADLQNDPADIPKLLAKMGEGFEIVSGWRYHRQDKISRRIPSILANRMISLLTGVRLHDFGCSLKAYRANCIRSIHPYSDMHRFFPAVASITGARTAEVPVNHRARAFGASKYGMSRILKVLADLFTVFMITRFTSNPARLFAVLSLPCLIVGGGLGLFVLGQPPADSVANTQMGASLLCFWLALHFLLLSALGTMVLKSREDHPERLCDVTATVL